MFCSWYRERSHHQGSSTRWTLRKHVVGVCDNGSKAGGVDDGAAGAADGGDVREVQLEGYCKHAVGVCDHGDKAGKRMRGQLERRAEVISGQINSQDIANTLANTLWAFATKSIKSGERMMEPNMFIATFGCQRFHRPPK